jgi:alginate O-acetyltransferase complex protein AlgI
MVFSSFVFLFCFFPIVSLVYLLAPRGCRNWVLLIASALFYSWGAPHVLPFLILSCIVDYLLGSKLSPKLVVENQLSEASRRRIFVFGIALNLSGLLYFKYAEFLLAELRPFLEGVGIHTPVLDPILLPLGISFFTFHKISYLGDVFRGKVAPAASLVDYILYIIFFPQLVAGPIIRYADVAMQFRGRVHSADKVFDGLVRFSIGLSKKVLIADSLGAVVDRILHLPGTSLGQGPVWLAMICYSFQIYFDFSGYSDMALGLARVFGFSFKENFNRPYSAASFTEFWRRWHMSLSMFMREYVYIPLGGNVGTRLRVALNLWITFLLSGLWHGASWNFIVWGAFHGFFLSLDKLGLKQWTSRAPRPLMVGVTFVLVTVGWVFFRAESLPRALELLSIMVGVSGNVVPAVPRGFLIDNRDLIMLAIAALVSFMPYANRRTHETTQLRWIPVQGVCVLVLLLLSSASLASRGFAPFLYFRF